MLVTDSVRNNGYSIFEFNFTQSHTNTNRYKQLYDLTNQNICASAFFQHGTVILNIDDQITSLNAEHHNHNIDDWVNRLINCHSNDCDKINIPCSMLEPWQSNNTTMFNFLVQYGQKYVGYIMIYWFGDSNVYIRHMCRFMECNLAGGGSFLPPLDINEYNYGITDHVGGQFIPIMESHLVSKTRFDLEYDNPPD